jgi:hypothetical protein
MRCLVIIGLLLLASPGLASPRFVSPGLASPEGTFVVIQKVEGDRITVTKASADDQNRAAGRSGRPGAQRGTDDTQQSGAPARDGRRDGKGMGRGGRQPQGRSATPTEVLKVPTDAKITTASRERRTFEFRVGTELAGGLRHEIFRDMTRPLEARVVTQDGRIVELNVVTATSDINQSATDPESGARVIAVRPKRPPMKRSRH